MAKDKVLRSYVVLRFLSALFFAVIVTVNLVYQATVVGLNPLQMVLVGTLLEFVSFVFEVPTGIVADLYSRKLSVIIGVVLVGAGFMLEGLIPLFATVLLAQVIWGIGYTFISGAREAWIADEVGDKDAGKAFMKGQRAGQVGTFVGIAASMVLANIDIRIPIIIGGLLYAMQAFFIAIFMPENNFIPTPAKKRETFWSMKRILVQGVGLVKSSNVMLTIIATGVIFGMFSEGLDRLWTPYMLTDFTFPAIGNIKPVIWFGAISMVSAILTALSTKIFEKKVDLLSHQSTVGALLLIHILLIIGVIGFGFSASFIMAVAMYWLSTVFRELREPIYNAWINQNVTSNVRATVFSMCSQANAIGQVVGGPILGVIASVIAIRASIVVAGLILVPTIFLYVYSAKNHKLAAD
jgi:DHA3 family tetracycline resistance protein-like MFS transporter